MEPASPARRRRKPDFEINPETEDVTFVNEAWRIVPPDIAEAIDRRFAENKAKGRGLGRDASLTACH